MAFVVYCSPAGATRHVAQIVENTLRSLGNEVILFDVGKDRDVSPLLSKLKRAPEETCLYIGSPVYASHAVPPIMAFIAELPDVSKGYAVPFVTWGGASSGIALYEMGTLLHKKGFALLGAAKILSIHSLMWRSSVPLGHGHPDSTDDRMIESLVLDITKKLTAKQVKPLPLSDLAYQPKDLHDAMEKRTLKDASLHFPKRQVVEASCTKCGVCEEACPSGALTCAPYPKFDSSCFFCFNCVRLCPEMAIQADMSPAEERIRERAQTLAERPFSKVFL